MRSKRRTPTFIVDERNPDAIVSPTMRLADYALLIATHLKGGKGGVHAKHWCEFHEPMRVGQSVKVEGKITATYRKRGKFYFTLEYESRDAATESTAGAPGDHVGAAERQGRDAMSAARD